MTAQGLRLLRQAPVAVQEALIAAIDVLPLADRRHLARSLSTIARSVAPASVGAHPPMFLGGQATRQRRALR